MEDRAGADEGDQFGCVDFAPATPEQPSIGLTVKDLDARRLTCYGAAMSPTNSMSEAFDVVVIGSGVGGMTAGAQLAMAGLRPLILESADRLGGRYSTIEIDGFKVPTGAVATEYPGPWANLVEKDLGLDVGFRVPNPPAKVRFSRGDVTAGAQAWAFMIKRVAKSAAGLADAVRRAGPHEGKGMTLAEWSAKYTKSKTVLSLMQSLSAAVFTVNAEEMEASMFFAWLRATGGYKNVAFAAGGNVSVVDAVGDAIIERGGEVRKNWTATEIETKERLAVAVHATGPDGSSHRIPTKAVISNIGPVFTARLLENSPFAAEFAKRVEGLEFTSIIALAFSSDFELLPTTPGFLNMTDAERLCTVANLTHTCPELAPRGKKLYQAYSVPRPSIGGSFDEQYELDLLKKDLLDKVEGFDPAEVIHTQIFRTAESPGMRCAPGTDPTGETPIPNLYDTGDGAKLARGGVGTSGSALSAIDVTDKLLRSRFINAE